MNGKRFLLITILSCFALASVPASWGSSLDTGQKEASALYDNGEFAQAYKKYLKLGKKGDHFSQYRISYMSLKGQGTKEDVIESLAWAVLAAQDGRDDLVDYKQVLTGLVPADKRKKAQSKVDYYMRRWGENDNSNEPSKLSSRCTGSRLSANCGASSSKSVFIQWDRHDMNLGELERRIEALNDSIAHSIAGSSTGR
jgi:hypothetical protein